VGGAAGSGFRASGRSLALYARFGAQRQLRSLGRISLEHGDTLLSLQLPPGSVHFEEPPLCHQRGILVTMPEQLGVTESSSVDHQRG
jgi:hypothetical protein